MLYFFSLAFYSNDQAWCSRNVDENGFHILEDVGSVECGPDCPMHPNAFTTDDTLKVTYSNIDEKEIMIALKLHGIMSSSLLLIGLMVTGLGKI